jgi:hypothetical protein
MAKWRLRPIKRRLTIVGIRCADHMTPFYPQKLALTSLTSGGPRDLKGAEFVLSRHMPEGTEQINDLPPKPTQVLVLGTLTRRTNKLRGP